ncbi:MAG: hypothetical protein IPI49_21810 [Myxococcales bacterium]|nr:hypothetical protein [Myxococcales bacterium]
MEPLVTPPLRPENNFRSDDRRRRRRPGCDHRLFLEGHHLQHWADGGETRPSASSQKF